MSGELLRGRRVIICEDEGLQAMGLARAAASMGSTEVVTVTTGEAAIEEAQRSRPDLVLIDINLPGISGIEALRQIKDEMDTCVVMITVHTEEQVIQEALAAGADGYFPKPIQFDEV